MFAVSVSHIALQTIELFLSRDVITKCIHLIHLQMHV